MLCARCFARTKCHLKGIVAVICFGFNLGYTVVRHINHRDCLEGIPVFGGLLLIALATDRTSVTDGLAPWFLIARVFQSSVHLSSLSVPAVNARFLAFLAQIGIGAYWVWALLVA